MSLVGVHQCRRAGTEICENEGELYLFYPDARNSSLARRRDCANRARKRLSYEDMTGEKDTLAQYDVKLLRNEVFNGRSCHVLQFDAKTRTVAYPRQVVWVDTETYMVWRGEFSTQSGRLLKEMEVLETMEADGRTLPGVTRISDKMKRDSATEMRLVKLDIDINLDPAIFTLQNLTW